MKYASVFARSMGLVAFAALVPLTSCAGSRQSSGGCHYESWQGKCRLTSVRTARTIERFPTSFVVLEATYEPQSTEGTFSPPPFKRELTAPAASEADLTNHLKRYELIDCAVQQPAGDACAPAMVAQIPEFLAAASGPTGPVGCAKIEQSGNAPVPSTATLPGPFQFEAESSMSTPDIEKMADDAARLILQNPKYECIAVKGKTAPGEPFTLANDRAQLVRKLLEARGVDHTRITVFEATAPTYTANPNDDQPVASEQRRVHLAVVVYDGQGGGP
jgi:outer membrane protein OmpA-like peptidoglycan-associated protein